MGDENALLSPMNTTGGKRAARSGELIRWLDQITRNDALSVGWKGAHLGELVRARLPVPPGFVITSRAWLAALEASGLQSELRQLFNAAPIDEARRIDEVAANVRELMNSVEIPAELRQAITAAYARLGANMRVAVRSSATTEDAGTGGMHPTFTNVCGERDLLDRIRNCWASAYGARVLAYRRSHGMTERPQLAVVVQTMVDFARCGVMFTANPSTSGTDTIIVEAMLGLGEVVAGGQVEFDTYTVTKSTLRLRQARTGHKAFKLARDAMGEELSVQLLAAGAVRQVLSDREVEALAEVAVKVEKHYGVPQSVEWAESGGQFFLMQTRPITALVPPSSRTSSW